MKQFGKRKQFQNNGDTRNSLRCGKVKEDGKQMTRKHTEEFELAHLYVKLW